MPTALAVTKLSEHLKKSPRYSTETDADRSYPARILPYHSMRNSDSKKNPRFFLIVGCPRSGTYLLSLLLQSSVPVAIPVETHFIPLFFPLRGLFGDLSVTKNLQNFLKCIYDFLAIWTPRSAYGRDLSLIKKNSLLCTYNSEIKFVNRDQDYGDLVQNLFAEYGKKKNTLTTGDKSAFFHHVPLHLYKNIIPQIKIIHIVRDGRDVSLSWKKTWFGPGSIAVAAREWRKHVQGNRRWGQENPSQYMEVRYEDLLDNCEEVLERIRTFLNLQYIQENILPPQNDLARVLSEGNTHTLLQGPLIKTNKDKWRESLSLSDQALFEYIAGDMLIESGYDSLATEFSLPTKIALSFKIRFFYLKDFFSKRNFKLKIKTLLPWIIWICSCLRIPLVRILNSNRFPDYLLFYSRATNKN